MCFRSVVFGFIPGFCQDWIKDCISMNRPILNFKTLPGRDASNSPHVDHFLDPDSKLPIIFPEREHISSTISDTKNDDFIQMNIWAGVRIRIKGNLLYANFAPSRKE